MITFEPCTRRRKEDAGVQACLLSDVSGKSQKCHLFELIRKKKSHSQDSESEEEIKVYHARSPVPPSITSNYTETAPAHETVRPARTFYFGEEQIIKPAATPKISSWSSSTQYDVIYPFY